DKIAKVRQQELEVPETVVGVVTQDNLVPALDQKLEAPRVHVSKKGYSHSGAMPELVSK
ncbi:unnamed protein product, partial [marine sediment metagenome]